MPPRRTSQRCASCGAIPDVKLTLAARAQVCLACGFVLDRDMKAALNMLQVGVADLPGGNDLVHWEKAAHRLECQAQNAALYTCGT